MFSPAAPQVLQVVSFNADLSRPAAGRRLVAYSWNFGDGTVQSGSTTTHAFAASGTYAVVLTVTDGLNQTGTTSQTLSVGAALPTASFVFSPAAPQVL